MRQLRKQKSSGDSNGMREATAPRKRSYELRSGNNDEEEDVAAASGGFKGVGSRIAEMEARCKKFRR